MQRRHNDLLCQSCFDHIFGAHRLIVGTTGLNMSAVGFRSEFSDTAKGYGIDLQKSNHRFLFFLYTASLVISPTFSYEALQ